MPDIDSDFSEEELEALASESARLQQRALAAHAIARGAIEETFDLIAQSDRKGWFLLDVATNPSMPDVLRELRQAADGRHAKCAEVQVVATEPVISALQITLPPGVNFVFEVVAEGNLWITRDHLDFEPADLVLLYGDSEFRASPTGAPNAARLGPSLRHCVPASIVKQARSAGSFTLSLETRVRGAISSVVDPGTEITPESRSTAGASDSTSPLWWANLRELLSHRHIDINLTRSAESWAALPIAALAQGGEPVPVGRLSTDETSPLILKAAVSPQSSHAAVLLLAESTPPQFLHPAVAVPLDRAPAFDAAELVTRGELEVWLSAPAGKYCLVLLVSTQPTLAFDVLTRIATGTAALHELVEALISDTNRGVIKIGHVDIELVDEP